MHGLAQLGLGQFFRALAGLQDLPDRAATEDVARAGRIDDLDALQAVYMAAGVLVLKPAAVCTTGGKDQLHAIFTQDLLCALLRAQAEQELDLFIADLDHIRL